MSQVEREYRGPRTATGTSKEATKQIAENLATYGHRAAMRATAIVPAPLDYARRMTPADIAILMRARDRGTGLQVSVTDARVIRSKGLVEAGTDGQHLTAFALLVLRALRSGLV